MSGGTLFDYIRDHPEGLIEEEAKRLFRDIVIGIRDLHRAVSTVFMNCENGCLCRT